MNVYFIIIIILLLVIIGILLYLLIRSNRSRVYFEKEQDLLNSKLKYFQLESLESRLDPHLFKNILNSVQSLAYQTYYALDKMAGVMDYIMYDSQKKFVSLREEHDFAIKLIDINKIKLNPLFRLDVRSVIQEGELLYDEDLVAPLICVELIENAFKHADLQSSDSFISVLFKMKKGQFDLIVSNKASSKKGLEKEHGGFGLSALQQRLELIYGSYFKLEKSFDSQVYTMHLKLNLYDFKDKMHTLR
ncbi:MULTISPECIES: sensor histidine kinase [Myroides]|uniref:Histidine kinase n=1 Tax=Myroides albus TaxID=2562892 RepID=A0A6I3LMU5_9FLAO|nr:MULTISPECIES: histidine kinase [Myroides]MTG99174.1 histidine kinase [Myroides albus]MVX36903.1 histidine kinase [Myroides sp. LoEW2-1]UVD80198.1 histidine kinase [Myroides albus]